MYDIINIQVTMHRSSTSFASSNNSAPFKTSTRVCQETGFLPLPFSHSRKISIEICIPSPQCFLVISWILAPLVSSRSRMPNTSQSDPISLGMLTSRSLQGNLSSSGSVGGIPEVKKTSYRSRW